MFFKDTYSHDSSKITNAYIIKKKDRGSEEKEKKNTEKKIKYMLANKYVTFWNNFRTLITSHSFET